MISLHQTATARQFTRVTQAKAYLRPRGQQERLALCYRSQLPDYLKPLANTLCFEADSEGLVRWTVAELTEHRHYLGHKALSERSVRYHLRVLEAIGFLEVVSGGRGRGHTRVYRVHAERLSEITRHIPHPTRDPAWPKAPPPAKGATKRGNERGNGRRGPYRTRTELKNTGERPVTKREWEDAKRAYELGGGCRHYSDPCPVWTDCVDRIVYARRGRASR